MKLTLVNSGLLLNYLRLCGHQMTDERSWSEHDKTLFQFCLYFNIWASSCVIT